MSKKILIDLLKLRDYENHLAEGVHTSPDFNNEFKTIRELATFRFTCRKCEAAPCIDVCTAGALEKDEKGIINRAINLCVRCKSCIAICPFGTLMDDLFEKKPRINFFNLKDDQELKKFVDACPENTVIFYEGDEDTDKNIYKLTEKVLVKEFIWEQ